ncbi:hypothetical protein M758_UG191200 [Ceratodon purpureus]|nr:hypothetical protein M758_UG191200 [Ceratodon purpureus]
MHPLRFMLFIIIFEKHSIAGNMEWAGTLVADMEEHGLEASLGLYNRMMDGYAHCHAKVHCLNVFRKLKDTGMSPTVVSYGCLINLYSKVYAYPC